MDRIRRVKQLLGLVAFLALAVPVASRSIGIANACADPPCGACRSGTWNPCDYSCCGSSWDCANCTSCAD